MATQFRKPDGTFTTDRSYAQHVAPVDVLNAWRNVSSRIPGQFAVGTAAHEADFIENERVSGDQGDGSDSDGVFQLSRGEAIKAGRPLADLFTLEDAATVFAVTMHRNLDRILAAAGLADAAALPGDVWAYLFVSHNQGIAAAEKTIKAYGLDWAAYKSRNINAARAALAAASAADRPAAQKKVTFWEHVASYGDDVISGGSSWDRSWDELPPPPPDVDAPDPLSSPLTLVGIGLVAFWLLGKVLG